MKLPLPTPGVGEVPAVAFMSHVPDGSVKSELMDCKLMLPAVPPPVAPVTDTLLKAPTVMPPDPLLVMVIEPPLLP